MGQRRALKAEGEEAPTFTGALFQGMQLGRTLPSTPIEKLNADRLKLEAASLALRQSIHEDEYKLRKQNQLLDEAEYRAKLQQDLNDNQGLRQATTELDYLMGRGDIDLVRQYPVPEGMSLQGQEAVLKVKSDLIKGEQFKRLDEIQAMKARLQELGVSPQDYENLSYKGLQAFVDKLTDMQESERAREQFEADLERVKQVPGVRTVTGRLDGMQVTIDLLTEEKVDGLSKKEVATKLLETNEALGKAQGDSPPNEQLITALEGNFNVIAHKAREMGLQVPGEPLTTPGQGNSTRQGDSTGEADFNAVARIVNERTASTSALSDMVTEDPTKALKDFLVNP